MSSGSFLCPKYSMVALFGHQRGLACTSLRDAFVRLARSIRRRVPIGVAIRIGECGHVLHPVQKVEVLGKGLRGSANWHDVLEIGTVEDFAQLDGLSPHQNWLLFEIHKALTSGVIRGAERSLGDAARFTRLDRCPSTLSKLSRSQLSDFFSGGRCLHCSQFLIDCACRSRC